MYVMIKPSWDLPALRSSMGEGTFREKEGGNVAVATSVMYFLFVLWVR